VHHHVTLKRLIAEGDFVVTVVETRGRVVGDFYGVPGQGKPFTNREAVVYGFEGGKIATVDPYFDDLKIATEQFGARLVPDQPVR
jgi:predicted ester cyclase